MSWQNNQKNFLLILTTLVLALSLAVFLRKKILWTFELSEIQGQVSKLAYDKAKETNHPLSIIVGDSGAKQALDPSLISNQLFNLSLSGASPALLEEHLKQFGPSKVRCSFLQTTYDPNIAFGDTRLELETHLQHLSLINLIHQYLDSKITKQYPAQNYSLFQYLAFHYLYKLKLVVMPDGTFSSHRQLNFLLNKEQKTFDLSDIYKNSVDKRGFIQLSSAFRQMRKSEFNRYNRYKFWFKSNLQIDSEIKPLYEYLKTISDHVYYIELPLFSNPTFSSDNYKKHKTAHLCPHLGIEPENCITFSSYSNVLLFTNPAHLNKDGAQVFSQKFKEVFSKCFN